MTYIQAKDMVITKNKAANICALLKKKNHDELQITNCEIDCDVSCWFDDTPHLEYLFFSNNRSIKTCASNLKSPISRPFKELRVYDILVSEKDTQHLAHVLSMFKIQTLVLSCIYKDEARQTDSIDMRHVLAGTSSVDVFLDKMNIDVVDELLQGFTQALTTKRVSFGSHIEMTAVCDGLRRLLLNDKSKELDVAFGGIYSMNFFAQILHVLSNRRRSNQHIIIRFINVKLPAEVPKINECLPEVFHCDNLSVEIIGTFHYGEIVAKLAQNKGATYLSLPCLPRRTDRNIFFGKYPNITNITVNSTYTQPFSQDTECPQLRVLAIKHSRLTTIPSCVLLTRLDIAQSLFCVNLENLKYSKVLECIRIDVYKTCPELTGQLASYLASDSSQCLTTFEFNTFKILSSEINLLFSGLTNCLALRHIKVTYTRLADQHIEALAFSISNFLENNKFLETLEIPLPFRTNDLNALRNSKITNLTTFALEDRQTGSNIMAILKRNTDNHTSLTTSMLTRCLDAINYDPIFRSEQRRVFSDLWNDLIGRSGPT